ncbi:uncharacterized protein LOC144769461 [Lissotriton helveticus]
MAAADVVRNREEAAIGMFDNAPIVDNDPKGLVTPLNTGTNAMKELFKKLEKAMRAEQSKWWEKKSLSRYLEVGRAPRGLRSLLAPSFENPDPEMLIEWAGCNLDYSSGLLKILIKYAESDGEKLGVKINDLNEQIKQLNDAEQEKRLRETMTQRLTKEEEVIKRRKTFKFQRDKLDYQNGRIFTFSKKYDQPKVPTGVPSGGAGQSSSRNISPSTSESNLSSIPGSESENEQRNMNEAVGFTKRSLGEEVECLRNDRRQTLRSHTAGMKTGRNATSNASGGGEGEQHTGKKKPAAQGRGRKRWNRK